MSSFSALVGSADSHADYLWRNGSLVPWADATVHATSVGHASVSSVFEGIKAYWNGEQEQLYVFRLREHMQRYVDSIRMVRLSQPYSVDDLCTATLELLRANGTREDTYIRPWMFVGGMVRRVMSPAGSPLEMLIDSWSFQSRLLAGEGARVCVSSWTRVGDNQMPPRIKAFSNYHNGRMALLEAEQHGYDSAIMLNERLKVAEGPGACVGMLRHGAFVTPRVTDGVLESITRDTMLELARDDEGLTVQEREVDRTELYVADELFYMGTGREMWPIAQVDGLPVGNGEPGPVCMKLARTYNDLVRGIDPRHSDWRTAVW